MINEQILMDDYGYIRFPNRIVELEETQGLTIVKTYEFADRRIALVFNNGQFILFTPKTGWEFPSIEINERFDIRNLSKDDDDNPLLSPTQVKKFNYHLKTIDGKNTQEIRKKQYEILKKEFESND